MADVDHRQLLEAKHWLVNGLAGASGQIPADVRFRLNPTLFLAPQPQKFYTPNFFDSKLLSVSRRLTLARRLLLAQCSHIPIYPMQQKECLPVEEHASRQHAVKPLVTAKDRPKR